MLAARTRPAGPAALCALLLAAFHQAAAEDLPRRLFVGNMVYNMPGVGPHSFIPEAMGGYPEPVPDEVAALGLTTGAPMTNFFAQFGWPFLVLEDGRPVAFTAEPVPTADATYPEARHLDSLDGEADLRDLSYRRVGDAVRIRARIFDGTPRGVGPDGAIDADAIDVFEGRAAASDQPGCFRIETEWSKEIYHRGTTALIFTAKETMPYGKAEICLQIDQTSAQPDGSTAYRLKAHVTGTVGRRKTEAERLDETGYMIGLAPGQDSGAGAYIAASGAVDFHGQALVEDIDRFAAELERSIERHAYDLAADQVASLNAYLGDLDAEGIAWHWVRRPTAAGVARYNDLMQATETFRLTFLDIQARLNDVRHQLEVLRTNFSGNVVKSMLKSTINWLDVVPTDPISGLAGYSDIADALLLPRSLQGWKETAVSDTSILASQVAAIGKFEALETDLANHLNEIVAARRALYDRIRDNDEERVLELDAALRSN